MKGMYKYQKKGGSKDEKGFKKRTASNVLCYFSSGTHNTRTHNTHSLSGTFKSATSPFYL